MMIPEIEDHRVLDDAIPNNDGYSTTTSGMKRKKRTTRGWEILVRWKDGSSDWIILKDLKESCPVELADYSFAQGIQDELAFAWWVPCVHKKRKSIIAKLKLKYWQRTHKYGIRVPRSMGRRRHPRDAKRMNCIRSLWRRNRNINWLPEDIGTLSVQRETRGEFPTQGPVLCRRPQDKVSGIGHLQYRRVPRFGENHLDDRSFE
jgi:hypothetical protein